MSLFIAMFSFSLVMSISPGPVNMVIVSSGANYGIRKTFSFVSGATVGFTSLLLFIGLGFDKILDLYPSLLMYLSVAGSMFIIYMGYSIVTSKPKLSIKESKQPTFVQGFLLQWLNPKAWVACVAGVPLFSTPNENKLFIIFCFVYFVVCYLSLFSWAVLGNKTAMLLNNDFKLQTFNRLMGVLLIATALFLLYVQFNI